MRTWLYLNTSRAFSNYCRQPEYDEDEFYTNSMERNVKLSATSPRLLLVDIFPASIISANDRSRSPSKSLYTSAW